MLSPRTSLGVAQTVFYVPTVAVAIYLVVKFWRNRPIMAWWPLITLSLIRLAGGIVTIVLGQHQNDLGLIIAAFVLLNVGIVPLTLAMLGQMRIILTDNYADYPRAKSIAGFLRGLVIAAVALISAGGGLSTTSHSVSKALSVAGYAVFAVILCTLIGMQIYFFRQRFGLAESSRKVLMANALVVPFLVVRTVYGFLEVTTFPDLHSPWDPLYGSIYAFAFMCLFMEYICVWIYFALGFWLPADRGVSELPRHEEKHVPRMGAMVEL